MEQQLSIMNPEPGSVVLSHRWIHPVPTRMPCRDSHDALTHQGQILSIASHTGQPSSMPMLPGERI